MGRPKQNRWFLREWRKHREYTQDRLAEMTDLSKPFISQLERGDRQYTQETLERLATALQCSPADLLNRDPSEPEGIQSIWDTLSPTERVQAKAVIDALRKTGTNG
jgi:transcriptional regulator with XRE-family HTH domain